MKIDDIITYEEEEYKFENEDGDMLFFRGYPPSLSGEDKILNIRECELQAYFFENAAKPLIKYLSENHNPHVMAVITPVSSELLEGMCSTGLGLDYIRD
jgi:hypothetical protein